MLILFRLVLAISEVWLATRLKQRHNDDKKRRVLTYNIANYS